MLFGAVMLAGCFDSATKEAVAKLSKEEEQVLDAMMFLFSGIEDNVKNGGLTPWRREVKGRSVEYSSVGCLWVEGCTFIGSSDEEENRKMRQSTYVRYLIRVSLNEPCVFYFEDITEFSKGDSTEDFGGHSSKGVSHIFNLVNAHLFNLNVEDATLLPAAIEMAGPRVDCTEFGCENAWNSRFSEMDLGRFNGGNFENNRRLRAMALIKKTCPGKPY
jgi:hypothetical protein